jgi:lipoprotein-anchoring transpeptidase ErfK/SrfK
MKKRSKKNNSRLYLLLGAITVLVCMVLGAAAWTAVTHPAFASIMHRAQSPAQPVQENLWAQVEIAKPLPNPVNMSAFAQQAADTSPSDASPSATPEPTLEPSLVPTDQPTDIPTSVPTEEPTSPPEATETPAQLSMEIVVDTPTSAYVPPTYSAPNQVYASSGNGARWVDVDLTNQRVYAYEGDVIVNSFIVSTGTWAYPTVTGQYHIYVKYLSAKMSGPGYYLPNVPYIMYFYKGYGLHGTYWHNNFGTPMSHGCVNLRTDDAAWLYNWASVGTLVNVHY